MSRTITVGDKSWKTTNVKPKTSPYLELVKGGEVVYGVLKDKKPDGATLEFYKNNKKYYLSDPSTYIGSNTSALNVKYSLGGNASPYTYNHYTTWSHNINSDEELVIMCNTESSIRCIRKKSPPCNDCDECTGGDRYRSQSKSINTEELQDSYRKFFGMRTESASSTDVRVALVSPPKCYDGGGGTRPDGGCTEVYNNVPCTIDNFMDMPSVTTIDADTFQESYEGSVNFKKEIMFSSIPTSWATIFSYYPFRHKGSSSNWLDRSSICVQLQIMRSGQTLHVRRRIETSIDQAAKGMRGQHWFISNNICYGVHTKI